MIRHGVNGGGAIALSPAPFGAELAVRQMLENVRRLEGNRWSARCPCHEDRDNSMVVWLEGDRLSFKCYAGCDPKEITDALYDKYPEYGALLGREQSEAKAMKDINESALDWYANYTGVSKEVLSKLPITFTSTEIIFRFDGVDKYKVRIKGQKGAIWRGSGHTPELWPIPSGNVGEDIIITEGESDCIVARSLGFEAYTITKGAAASLSPSVLVALRRRGARRIVVIMDADQAGRQAATKIVLAARQSGLAAIDLDLVAEGLIEPLWGQKDLRDAYRAGKGKDIIEAIRHMLYQADEARPAVPRPLSEIMSEETEVEYTIAGLLRVGGTAILAGEPKLGKSQLSLDIALAVARGESILGLEVKQGKVIYYALEDAEDIVRDRVRARGLEGNDNLFIGTLSPVIGDNIALLEEHIDIIQPSLVIIDTLRATAVGLGRSENEAGFADTLYRVAKLCRERGVSALFVHHTVKATSGNPIADVRGTSAIAGSVDVVAAMYKKDDNLRLVWRGRYGSSEIKLEQYPNGSFNYRPALLDSAMQYNEEYKKRLEERLARYEEACRKHSDKSGRVDVRKVLLAMWGTKDNKEAWNKTYKALDELVRRQRLRKKERQYYIVQAKNEENSSAPPYDSSTAREDNTQKKRSLLAEVRQVLGATKGGPLTTKIAGLVHEAYNALVARNGDKAKEVLLQGYNIMKDDNEGADKDDYKSALSILDVGMFMYLFSRADERLRAIGWRLWDNRQLLEGDLLDCFRACSKYLELVSGGKNKQEAIEEVAGNDKLKQILLSYAET